MADCDYCGEPGDTDTDVLVRFEPYDEQSFTQEHDLDHVSGAYVCYFCAVEISDMIQEKVQTRARIARLKTDQFTITPGVNHGGTLH